MSESMGHAIAETPAGVARALLYIVRASLTFFLHQSIIQTILPYLSSVMTTSMLLDWWMLGFFYGVGRWTIIYILGGRHKHMKHVRPLSPSHPNITFQSTSHLYTSRQVPSRLCRWKPPHFCHMIGHCIVGLMLNDIINQSITARFFFY